MRLHPITGCNMCCSTLFRQQVSVDYGTLNSQFDWSAIHKKWTGSLLAHWPDLILLAAMVKPQPLVTAPRTCPLLTLTSQVQPAQIPAVRCNMAFVHRCCFEVLDYCKHQLVGKWFTNPQCNRALSRSATHSHSHTATDLVSAAIGYR